MAGKTQLSGSNEPATVTYWHRIEFTRYAPPVDEWDNPIGNGTVGLNHHRYKVIKTTSKGVWLAMAGHGEIGVIGEPARKFVLFDSKKQFASPTFEQAKEKFKRRKERQIAILKAEIRSIQEALEQVDAFKPNE